MYQLKKNLAFLCCIANSPMPVDFSDPFFTTQEKSSITVENGFILSGAFSFYSLQGTAFNNNSSAQFYSKLSPSVKLSYINQLSDKFLYHLESELNSISFQKSNSDISLKKNNLNLKNLNLGLGMEITSSFFYFLSLGLKDQIHYKSDLNSLGIEFISIPIQYAGLQLGYKFNDSLKKYLFSVTANYDYLKATTNNGVELKSGFENKLAIAVQKTNIKNTSMGLFFIFNEQKSNILKIKSQQTGFEIKYNF